MQQEYRFNRKTKGALLFMAIVMIFYRARVRKTARARRLCCEWLVVSTGAVHGGCLSGPGDAVR